MRRIKKNGMRVRGIKKKWEADELEKNLQDYKAEDDALKNLEERMEEQ